MMFLSRRKDGFTLMELIIVMALIGILTSISINIVIRTLEAQKADATLSEIHLLSSTAGEQISAFMEIWVSCPSR